MQQAMRVAFGRGRSDVSCFAAWVLLLGALWPSLASAEDLPSTRCPTVNATVAWGGTVNVDLDACEDFGLAEVSTSPSHGTATPGDPEPLESYNYNHNGTTPVGGGTDQFVVRDDVGDFITVNVTISAPTSAITVSPGTLAAMTAGTPFSQTLSSSGGTAPYTYTLSSGTLPPGISLSSSGVLSGTPTRRGAYGFSVRSQDDVGDFVIKGYSGDVDEPELSISPATATAGQGVPFSQTLTVTGGVAPHTFTIESGSFPAGISISGAGVISGTTSATPGDYPVVLRVTDASTGPGAYFETENFTLTVAALPTLSINDVAISEGNAGTTNFTFTASLSAPAGAGGVTFDIATATGTAASGTDFVANSLTSQTIPSGNSTYTFTVLVNGDALNEANETFFANITNVTGATVSDGQGQGTINNDDPQPSLTIVSRNIVERNAMTQAEALQVTLSAASGQTVTASYATTNGSATAGSDYVASSGTVSFGPGVTSAVINVGVTGDTVPEADETFTVTLSSPVNATIATATGTYTILNDDVPVTVSPTTVPNGAAGAAYNQAITASGGTGPYTFAITAGALPAGLTLASDGTLSGTPTAGGSFNFTVTGTDSSAVPGPFSGSQAYTLTIAAPTVTVVPTTLPGAMLGTAYNQSVTASGGTPSYTFAVTAGALPAGVSLSTSGALSGTPTAGGTFNFTITATDSSTGTGPFTGSRAYSLTVAAPTIMIAPASLPGATEFSAYSQTITASGGTAPYTFALTAGALPPGISLSSAGVLSGTPSTNGTFNFTVTATDGSTGTGPYTGSRAYTLTVALAPPVANAVAATVAHNSGANPITLNITGGAPTSVAIPTTPSNGTAIASGASITYQPNAGYAGADTFTYTATNAAGTSAPATVSITVSAPAILLAPTTLAAGVAGTAYSQTFSASGGTPSYSFSLPAGALPAGMSFSSAGVLSGTPSMAGTFNFTVRAADANGFTGDQAYSLVIAAPTIAIAPSTLPDAVAGVPFSQTFTASGGAATYSFSLPAGALPPGMSFSSAGVFSGTPLLAGTYNFTVRAADANGFTADQAYSVVVTTPTITVSPASLSDATAGVAYSESFTASGGTSPYNFSLVSGGLPVGMSMSSAGAFSGTPIIAGTYTFTVRAADANGFTGDRTYSLVVVAPTIAISPSTLPNGVPGTAYAQVLTASGGTAPYSFALTSGSIPAGTAMSSAGAFSGTPSIAGAYAFTVRVTDALGFTATTSYTITIAEAVPVAVNDTATTLGTAPVTVAVTANDTGVITSLAVGVPANGTAAVSGLNIVYTANAGFSGTDTFTYQAIGPGGSSAPATVTITVNPIPVAVAQTASVAAGLPVTVDLTTGASGGPFTGAAVVSLTPATSGTATIALVGGSYRLTYTPVTSFSGQATVQFTLSNAFATSAPATVTITVAPRPDPSREAEVRGLLDAQSDSARRFASSQIGNFQQRMENLHDNREGAQMSNRLSFAASQACVDYMGRKPGDPCGGLVASNGPVAAASSASAQGMDSEASTLGSANTFATWIGGVIRSGNQDGRGGGADADFETDGVSVGADYRISPAFALGAGLGYGRDKSDVGDNGSRVDADAYALAAYASFHPGDRFFLDAVFGYQRLSYDLRRFVTANDGFVSGSRDGRQWFGSISTGAQFQHDNWQLTPYARLDVSQTTLDAYVEQGDPIYALAYGEQDIDTTTGNIGFRFESRHPTAWGAFAPQLRMEYQHDFNGDSSATMQYADLLTGPVYRADLAGFDRNRFMIGLGAMFYLPRDMSLRAEYRGLFGNSGDRDNGVMLNFEKSY